MSRLCDCDRCKKAASGPEIAARFADLEGGFANLRKAAEAGAFEPVEPELHRQLWNVEISTRLLLKFMVKPRRLATYMNRQQKNLAIAPPPPSESFNPTGVPSVAERGFDPAPAPVEGTSEDAEGPA